MQMSFRFSLQRKSQLNADRRLPWRCAKHYPKIKGKHWCERIQIDRVQKTDFNTFALRLDFILIQPEPPVQLSVNFVPFQIHQAASP